ncbi:uncharacterized protein LOC133792365 [Humulus lupulus]|uniref:uncharacterized protein LOC133792365 n=1 Tax=Humulus lupulus TaxID=3486 RepID=UPI002B407633|nr:uncharacterized protein LOC133792365 [Humulus lupulus]
MDDSSSEEEPEPLRIQEVLTVDSPSPPLVPRPEEKRWNNQELQTSELLSSLRKPAQSALAHYYSIAHARAKNEELQSKLDVAKTALTVAQEGEKAAKAGLTASQKNEHDAKVALTTSQENEQAAKTAFSHEDPRPCSTSKPMKSQKETVHETIPSATPLVPELIPHVAASSFPAVSAPTGRRPKTTSSPTQSVSTEVEIDPSSYGFESSLSSDVMTPKEKGKRKSKAAWSKQTKKIKVAPAKGTSSISDSNPLSKFKTKENINPPPCTSSEDVSPKMEDSLLELDLSLTEPIPEEPHGDSFHEDMEEEAKSEEDPLETTPVASEPKGITPLAFPEFFAKITKHQEEMGWLHSLSDFDGFVPRFSPTEIAKVLNLVLVEIDDSIEFAKDQVLSELVGQAIIVSLSGAKSMGQHLMFPYVIYKLLDSQRPLKKSHETLIPPLVGPTYTVKEIKDDNAPSTA